MIGFWNSIGWSDVAAAAGLFLLSLITSIVVGGLLLKKMLALPADYFNREVALPSAGRSFLKHKLAWIIRNILGVVSILIGAILVIPGIPGQGTLLILIGSILLDFPGKRALERKLMGQSRVLSVINRIRIRYGKQPFQVKRPDESEDVSEARSDLKEPDRKNATPKPQELKSETKFKPADR
jgi:hypothetical protein